MNVRNTKLYDFMIEHYVEADNPMTLQEVADANGMTIGAIKNFCYRHEINKKRKYIETREQIKRLYYEGVNVKKIAKEFGVSPQYVYYMVSKNGAVR